MSAQKTVEVTFDTNTFRDLVEPHKRKQADFQAYEEVEAAIKDGKIKPFLSDTIVILEGIAGFARSDFYQQIKMQQKSETSPILRPRPDGTTEIRRTVTIQPDYTHRPQLPPELSQALQRGAELGFTYIKVPRVAQQMVEKHRYKQVDPADLSDVLARAGHALELIEDQGFGSAKARQLSKEMIAAQPELASMGEMRAFAFHGNWRKVSKVIAEWSDGDAIAAHYAHKHDIFCTRDEGKGAGVSSVLRADKRGWLAKEFGTVVMSPNELAAHIRSL